MVNLNNSFDEICKILDNIDKHLDKMERQIKDLSVISSSFVYFDVYQETLKENYDVYYNSIINCVSKLKRLNNVIKENLDNDYDKISRFFSREYDSALSDIISSLHNLDMNSVVQGKSTIVLENLDVYNNEN